jgi:hypothetical protein
MSGRSSRHSRLPALIILTVTALGCGKKAKGKPEADPAKVKALAEKMAMNPPSPGGVPVCKPGELTGGAAMTHTTLLRLAGHALEAKPEHADWINPAVLDHPAARLLADGKADAKALRQAAAELLAAPFFVDYRVDNVDAPLALAIKEPKPGFVHARAIRFAAGKPTCATVFYGRNTDEKTAWAISVSDRAVIDPAVAQAMRDDLAAEYVKAVPR